jgi:hypothetical protein
MSENRCITDDVKEGAIDRLTKADSGGDFARMRFVDLEILKNEVSEYVRFASGGETVLVTDRSRVVAEIVPPALVATTAPPRQPVMTFDELMQGLGGSREDR